MKRWISIFLLCILSTQMLPIEQVGRILFKGLMVEEVHDCGNSGFKEIKIKEIKTVSFYDVFGPGELAAADLDNRYSHWSDRLPHAPLVEIDSPPPNRA
jgi:hypothetical protein